MLRLNFDDMGQGSLLNPPLKERERKVKMEKEDE